MPYVDAEVRIVVEPSSTYNTLNANDRNAVRDEFLDQAFQNRNELTTLFTGWQSSTLEVEANGRPTAAQMENCLDPKLAAYNAVRLTADPGAAQPVLGASSQGYVHYEWVNGQLICFGARHLMAGGAGGLGSQRWVVTATTSVGSVPVFFSIEASFAVPV